MDDRAAKLALARKKLKDHQEKKGQELPKNIDILDSHSCNYNESNGRGVSHDTNTNNNVSTTSLPDNDTYLNPSVISYPNTNFQQDYVPNLQCPTVDATELLISSKRNIELQNIELQTKLSKLEADYSIIHQQCDSSYQRISVLEDELKNMNHNYQVINKQLLEKDLIVNRLNEANNVLLEERNNLQEQLEFTKTVLIAKESENESLKSQLENIQSQLETSQLQLQQITSGINTSEMKDHPSVDTLKHENEVLLQKISTLEHQLKLQMRENQQVNSHYENFVRELNNQLQNATRKNEEMGKEIQTLANRETSLVEQISEMEIRLQNYSSMVKNVTKEQTNSMSIVELEKEVKHVHKKWQDLDVKHKELEKLYAESLIKIEELSQKLIQENEDNKEVVSLTKLSADITSDKIAVQMATEQNKKLKQDIQGLEDAFVKMSKDKLELTEKLVAEKYLNQELTIKLAEIDEKAKDMQIKLKAKDDEMIRLQINFRELERKYEESNKVLNNNENVQVEMFEDNSCKNADEENTVPTCQHDHHHDTKIPKGDAMVKLQERFLKIMGEVADLSDEKHRLEHIITQLQNETETICEYVALYQQQRSLLKKRDEERNAQINIFQTECRRLQNQLDELSGILQKFAEDKQLASYFENQSKHEDIKKVMSLLKNLKSNTLIDPDNNMDFTNFNPCNCCSGKLIEI